MPTTDPNPRTTEPKLRPPDRLPTGDPRVEFDAPLVPVVTPSVDRPDDRSALRRDLREVRAVLERVESALDDGGDRR